MEYKVMLITPIIDNDSREITSYGLSFSIMNSSNDGLQETKKKLNDYL